MKKLYFVFLLLFTVAANAQDTSVNLKTLYQVNTYDGGKVLKTTFDDEQNNITVGYSNGLFTFGTENISTVNTNSLFILKSDNQTGEKIWLKKLTPDNKGSVKPYFSYTKNNQTYIVFNFRGILDINGSSYNSYDNDWMMMKIDQNGNVIWTSQLTIPIGFPSNSTSYKYYDMSIQNENAYILIANKIFHFKDTTGELISSFNNSNITLTSIEVTNQDLYFAGNSRINFDLGTESIKKNAGVILKSNLNFEVNAAIQFYPDSPTLTTNVSDLEISTDGTLNFVGTSVNKVTAYGENSLIKQCDYNTSNVYFNLFSGRISKDFTNMNWFAGNKLDLGYGSTVVKLYQLPNKHMALYFVRTSDSANVETISFFNNNYNGIVNGSILFQFDENGFASGNYNPFYGNKNTTFDFKSVNGVPNISEIFDGNLSVYGLMENYYFDKNFTKNVAGKKGIISSNVFRAMDDGSFYNGVVTQNNVSDYFGNNVSNLSDNSYTQMFSKISSTGNVEWKTGIKGIQMFPSNLYNFNKTNYIDTDGNITSLTRCSYDNNCILSKNNFSQTIPDSFGKVIITNIDNQGEVNWMKLTGINSDSYTVAEHNGYHYIFGLNQGLIEIDNIKYGIDDGYVHMNFFLIKIANNGEIKFVKQFFNNTDIYEANLSFDENDNIYGFLEPLVWEPETIDHYNFGNISIPSNSQKTDLLMVKFDSEGNPLFGKNFYENLPPDYSSGWFSDFRYNGNDFIAYGALIKNPDDTYYGVDGQIHSTPNDSGAINNFVTKISKQGDVTWETPIFSKTFNYSKIDIDNSSNIYVVGTWKEKLNIQNQNFNLSAVDMSVNLLKFDNQGNIKYTEELYTTPYIIGQLPSNIEISALNSKIVLAGNTFGNNLLNGDINNLNGDNYYIAVLEEEVLKTDEVDKINMNIYPNPTSDFIYIDTKEKINSIEVYDATGRKVNSKINHENQVDVTKLLKGVYYIRINTDVKSLTSKFIKN